MQDAHAFPDAVTKNSVFEDWEAVVTWRSREDLRRCLIRQAGEVSLLYQLTMLHTHGWTRQGSRSV